MVECWSYGVLLVVSPWYNVWGSWYQSKPLWIRSLCMAYHPVPSTMINIDLCFIYTHCEYVVLYIYIYVVWKHLHQVLPSRVGRLVNSRWLVIWLDILHSVKAQWIRVTISYWISLRVIYLLLTSRMIVLPPEKNIVVHLTMLYLIALYGLLVQNGKSACRHLAFSSTLCWILFHRG